MAHQRYINHLIGVYLPHPPPAMGGGDGPPPPRKPPIRLRGRESSGPLKSQFIGSIIFLLTEVGMWKLEVIRLLWKGIGSDLGSI